MANSPQTDRDTGSLDRPRPFGPVVQPRDSESDRGQSELVGVVLLFGMVIAGAIVIFLAGGAALDSVGDDAREQQTEQTFDQASSQIQTAFDGDTPRRIPDTDAERTVEENTTTIEFRRVNASAAPSDPSDLHWDAGDDGHAYEVALNSLRYDLGDEHLVFEGGGEWRVSGDTVMMRSPPEAAFTHDETAGLNVQLVDIDPDGSVSNGNLVADPRTRNLVNETALASDLDYYDPAAGADYGNDLMIVVESDHAGGWEAFFERTDEVDLSDPNVHYFNTTATGDDTVVLLFEGILQEQWSALGIDGWSADEYVNRTAGDTFDAAATVKNPDDATIPTGSEDVTLSVDGTVVETTTVDLDPGESTTVDFADIDLDSIIDADNPDTYRPITWRIETPDANVSGTFLPVVHHNQPFYRIDGHDSETNATALEEQVTVDLTNVGGTDAARNVTITLDNENIGQQEWTQSVQLDRWSEGNLSFAFNRSALPAGEYDYEIEVQNAPNVETQQVSGSFEVNDSEGAVGDVGEIVVTEPADVEVGVIGTEISAEWYSWQTDSWVKRWGAVTASVVVGDTRYRLLPNGDTQEIPIDEPHHTVPGRSMEDHNLNTFGTQTDTYGIDKEVEEGTVSIEATYWSCEDYSYAGSDTWSGRNYDHYECTDFGDPVTVDVSGGDDASLDSGFVMTRDANRSALPDIEEGYDRQRSVQEVFQDGTSDVDLVDGNLTLGENDFAFMMEVTSDAEELQEEYVEDNDVYPNSPYHLESDDQTERNLAAWEIGMNYRDDHPDDDYGDPNFNDVIGYAEVDPGETSVNPPDALKNVTVAGEPVDPEQTDNGDVDSPSGGGGVDVGVGEIVIG